MRIGNAERIPGSTGQLALLIFYLLVMDLTHLSGWLQQVCFEISGHRIPVEIATDSNGTPKNSVTTKLPTERRNCIDMPLIHQSLRRGEFILTWVPSRANISDSLAKETQKGTEHCS